MKLDVKSIMTYVTLAIFFWLSLFTTKLEINFIQEIIKMVFLFFLGYKSGSKKEGE